MSHPSKLLKPRRGLWDLELVSQKYLITWSGRTHAPIWWGLLSSPDRQCQNWVECGMPSLYLEGWKIGRYGEKPHIQSQKCSGWAVEKRAFSFHLWITQLLAIYIFLFCVVHFWTTKNYTTKKKKWFWELLNWYNTIALDMLKGGCKDGGTQWWLSQGWQICPDALSPAVFNHLHNLSSTHRLGECYFCFFDTVQVKIRIPR